MNKFNFDTNTILLDYISTTVISFYEIVDDFAKNKILEPPYQRGKRWSVPKSRKFLITAINRNSIGTIVLGRNRDNPLIEWVIDGLQRILTGIEFIENPKKYDFDISIEEASRILKEFKIPLQRRIYENHYEAYEAFKALNSSLSLTPREFYKGAITLCKNGEDYSQTIIDIFGKYEDRLTTRAGAGIKHTHKLERDSFACFYQYITRSKNISFWSTNAQTVTDVEEKQIEDLLAEYIKNNNHETISRDINFFSDYVAQHFALIETINNEITNHNSKKLTKTLSRFLLHAKIWTRNTNKLSISNYELFIKFLFTELNKKYKTYKTNFEIETNKGLFSEQIQSNKLSGFIDLLNLFDISLNDKKEKTPRIDGYDDSHIDPFSTNGNGKTIAEPASRNRSRGAKPIEKKDK